MTGWGAFLAAGAIVALTEYAEARHEGGSVILEACVQTAGVHEAYWVHFDGFQKGRKTCHEFAETGPAELVFDLRGKLLDTPLSIRVTEAGRSEPAVASVPAVVYPSGIANVSVSFPHPGHYVVSLASERDGVQLDFPLAVGVSKGFLTWLGEWGVEGMKRPNVLILYFLGIFGGLGLWKFSRVRR